MRKKKKLVHTSNFHKNRIVSVLVMSRLLDLSCILTVDSITVSFRSFAKSFKLGTTGSPQPHNTPRTGTEGNDRERGCHGRVDSLMVTVVHGAQ